MKLCVVSLGSTVTQSILVDNVLVYHSPIELESLSSKLYGQGIDRLVFFCQGSLAALAPKDTVKIGELTLHNNNLSIVLNEKDYMCLCDLSNGIEDVEIFNYMEYIASKYKDDSLIIVDKYLQDYCVMYIKNGTIEDFSKISKVNLSNKINYFRKTYKAEVFNEQLKNNYLTSSIKNFDKIPKDQLHCVDFLSYVIDNKGKSIVEKIDSFEFEESNTKSEKAFEGEGDKSRVSDVEYDIDDEDDSLEEYHNEKLEDFVEGARRKSKKKKRFFQKTISLDPDSQKEVDKFTDSILNIGLFAITIIAVVGLVSVFVFKGKVELSEKQIEVSQDRISQIDSVLLSIDKDVNTVGPLHTAFKDTVMVKDASINYKSGKSYVTLASKDKKEVDRHKKLLEKNFVIKESSDLGEVKMEETVLLKHKYLIVPRA